MLRGDQDAYGQMLQDQLRGLTAYEIVERDDGYIDAATAGAHRYFACFKDWPAHQRMAARYVKGRVLDVGCGAGRWALYLQQRGHEVLAMDNSPLALEVCRERGVREARLVSFTRIDSSLGRFDTILMMGNNFGLFGSLRRARWLLRRLVGLTNPGARIVAESTDPYDTSKPVHLAYQRRNRNRGRMGGQLRIRIRYQTCKTPRFDYLLVSKDEMKAILAGTGWQVERFLDSEGPRYAAVIEKK